MQSPNSSAKSCPDLSIVNMIPSSLRDKNKNFIKKKASRTQSQRIHFDQSNGDYDDYNHVYDRITEEESGENSTVSFEAKNRASNAKGHLHVEEQKMHTYLAQKFRQIVESAFAEDAENEQNGQTSQTSPPKNLAKISKYIANEANQLVNLQIVKYGSDYITSDEIMQVAQKAFKSYKDPMTALKTVSDLISNKNNKNREILYCGAQILEMIENKKKAEIDKTWNVKTTDRIKKVIFKDTDNLRKAFKNLAVRQRDMQRDLSSQQNKCNRNYQHWNCVIGSARDLKFSFWHTRRQCDAPLFLQKHLTLENEDQTESSTSRPQDSYIIFRHENLIILLFRAPNYDEVQPNNFQISVHQDNFARFRNLNLQKINIKKSNMTPFTQKKALEIILSVFQKRTNDNSCRMISTQFEKEFFDEKKEKNYYWNCFYGLKDQPIFVEVISSKKLPFGSFFQVEIDFIEIFVFCAAMFDEIPECTKKVN